MSRLAACLLVFVPAAALADTPVGLTLTVEATAPVLGVDAETEVRLRLVGDDPATLEAPRWATSAGQIEDVVMVNAREARARLVYPGERFPQVIIVAALAVIRGQPLRTATFVRLRATASPGFKTEPGALVTLVVGDKEFGPVTAGKDGAVRVPVVVPPGVDFATARSVNRHGAATEQSVALHPPPFARVLGIAPPSVIAGQPFEMSVFAVGPSGQPLPASLMRVQPSVGRAQPLGPGGEGEGRFLIRPPGDAAVTDFSVAASLDEGPGASPTPPWKQTLRLVPGPPARLTIAADRSRLSLAQPTTANVVVTAHDAWDNRTDAAQAQLHVDGTLTEAHERTQEHALFAVAPPRWQGRQTVTLEATLGPVYARHTIPLTDVPVIRTRRLPVPAPLDPTYVLTAQAALATADGQAAGAGAFFEALARPVPLPPALFIGGTTGAFWATTYAQDTLGLSRVRSVQLPLLLVLRGRLRPARAFEVLLGGGAGATFAWVSHRSLGLLVQATDVAPTFEATVDAAWGSGPGQVVVGARWLYTLLGKVSSGDTLTGNAAGLFLAAGYRHRF